MTSPKPTVILRPAPQPTTRIFSPDALRRLHRNFRVIDLESDDSDAALDAVLPEAFAIIGQPDLPRERLDKAPKLRALLNVEGNFYPNVDYATLFDQGTYVLGCGPAYSQAVAEYSLGLAIDLARGISREDRAFREGRERYLGDGNADAILLRRATVGLIGYGNLGRSLHRLLEPFEVSLRIFDPWIPDSVILEAGAAPASLEETLSETTFIFVLAAATEASQHLLGPRELDLISPGARVVFVSRSAVVDLDALLDRVRDGHFLAAVDVWPQEPMPADSPARTLNGLILSAHRAGGIPSAFTEIGDMVVDDLLQMNAGLPPARMQVAARELVNLYRNKAAGS